MWFESVVKAISGLKKYQVYLGRVPHFVSGPALIIFPLRRNVLVCGLAGIISIKRAAPLLSSEIADPGRLLELLEKMKRWDLQALLAHSQPAERYLDGADCLEEVEQGIRSLKREDSFARLFFDADLMHRFIVVIRAMKGLLSGEERELAEKAVLFPTSSMETINARLVSLRDTVWAAERDILGNVERIQKLSGRQKRDEITPSALRKYKKLIFLLNCLDRLEVRGRDSAGIQMVCTLAPAVGQQVMGLLTESGLQEAYVKRSQRGDLINGSVDLTTLPGRLDTAEAAAASLAFTCKTASIVGELGLNAANLRKAIEDDKIFHLLADLDTVFDAAILHTRWASVGAITQENCHPVNNFIVQNGNGDCAAPPQEDFPHYGKGAWTINVALNGDIDNYQSMRMELEKEAVCIAPEVTTDTKIIPLVVQKYLRGGDDLATAFRRAVNDFDGSHAIAMLSNLEPGKVYLALKGSGQSLYVGIAPDQYIFSSELYGLVEMTPFFIKMEGEKSANPNLAGAVGQIFILDQNSAGGLDGISACYYDGAPLPLDPQEISKAEITTRDIDRGDYPHYFLKEINESTLSVQKTLLGKYLIVGKEGGKEVHFNLGEDVMPAELRLALTSGRIARLVVIGHGTAAVAGEAIACSLQRYLFGSSIKCEAKIASELSGFCLADDLSDTMIIAITQSGTTTDTNRAVTMAAERGAMVVAIVNRRQSDITTKARGVFYTSDGRDIEMSVASTKAFYSQIVAGHILALYLAQLLKTRTDDFIAEELSILEKAPDLMKQVLDKKEQIKEAVEKMAAGGKYWAVVGSGPNKAAADEIRIKLSELCYRTISSDVVENKKHIDLSSEPLIIVCAAGSPEAVLGDIIKDAAIFKAHKAGVVVFTEEGEERFDDIADAIIALPCAPLPLPVILNTVAGHLWGYFAAMVIDDEATFFRSFRSRLNADLLDQTRKKYSFFEKIADRKLRGTIRDFYPVFHQRRQQGAFSLAHVKTLADLLLLLKYAGGKLPLEDFWQEFPGWGELSSPAELLDITLGHLIDELTRPIDAIRHQAKTVTVGTSRKEAPLQGPIFTLLKELNFSTHALTAKNVLALTTLQPAIGDLKGYTLYEVGNLDREGHPTDQSTIAILKRGGVAAGMQSRVDKSAVLMGTKRTIVSTEHIYVGYGKSDGASLVIAPLRGAQEVKYLLLMHVGFNDNLSLNQRKKVLGYRYNDICNLLNEYNLPWEDKYLQSMPLACLLGEPVEVIVEHIRQEATKLHDEGCI
ncbi:MAG: SIS domain-containing protein [Syntrophales bacterium]